MGMAARFTDGFLAEVSVSERNLLGRGYYAKTSVQYGQYTRGASVSFVDPYFLGYRVAAGAHTCRAPWQKGVALSRA